MKRALLVGINDYPGTSNDLAGCVNDTANLQGVLERAGGFGPVDMRRLVDKAATRAGILDGLSWLVSGASPGDTLVFHYSGHGAQVPDQDGDEVADHKDEVLCPRDFDWEGCCIRDDDLSVIFADLPKGALLEVVLDCCHSGTGTREIALGGPEARESVGAMKADLRGSEGGRDGRGGGDAGYRTARLRYMVPPPEVAARLSGRRAASAPVRRVGELVKARPRGINHVLWAACKSSQYSADAYIGGKPNGAFTYFFCDALRASDAGMARGELLVKVRAGLKSEGFDQVPQLECQTANRSRLAFSNPVAAPGGGD